ncbi:MAG: hypothetical protein ABIS18_08040 [Actinomycetota bacterium]
MPDAWSSELQPLDTETIFRALELEAVRYVIVGGLAAVLHRWSGTTADLDIVPADSSANLNKLGRALRSLNAVVYADPGRDDLFENGKPPEADDFGYTAEGLRRHRVWHLMSDSGPIDVTFEIAGVGDYQKLRNEAESRDVFGLNITVASLEHVITSKRAVARPKDLRVLPELEELRDDRGTA